MIKQSRGLYQVAYYLLWVVFHVIHPCWRVSGKENVPAEPYMMVCNHSASTDPIYLGLALHPKRLFRIMAKKELMEIPIFSWFLGKLGAFPVDREGNDAGAVITAIKVLRSGQALLVFPEGTRVRPGQRIEPKAGAVLLAARCKVPVVPAYVSREKKLFRPIQITYGKPYMVETTGRHIPPGEQTRLAREMMDRCYRLEV